MPQFCSVLTALQITNLALTCAILAFSAYKRYVKIPPNSKLLHKIKALIGLSNTPSASAGNSHTSSPQYPGQCVVVEGATEYPEDSSNHPEMNWDRV